VPREQAAKAARDAAAIMADLVAIQALRRAARHPDEVRRRVAAAVRDGKAPARPPGCARGVIGAKLRGANLRAADLERADVGPRSMRRAATGFR
jgi:hypothetical protein